MKRGKKSIRHEIWASANQFGHIVLSLPYDLQSCHCIEVCPRVQRVVFKHIKYLYHHRSFLGETQRNPTALIILKQIDIILTEIGAIVNFLLQKVHLSNCHVTFSLTLVHICMRLIEGIR